MSRWSVVLILASACGGDPADGGDGGGGDGGGGDGGGGASTWGACLDMGEGSDAGTCIEIEVPLDEATPPVDPAVAWPQVQAWAPTRVLWTRAADGATEDSVRAIVSAAADPLVVTRSGTSSGCRPGPELRLPVRIELDVGDGDLSATLYGAVDTAGEAPADMILTCIEANSVALGESWDVAAQAKVADVLNPGQVFVGYGAYLPGTLAQVSLGVIAWGDYRPADEWYGIQVGLWSGDLE